MSAPSPGVRPWPDSPLVVAYGLGVDSTAMLIEFARLGLRPDLILFADTGGEKPETYAYLRVIRPFLARVGFPDVVVVRYQPKRAAYHTLEEQCLHTGTLPSLAYGGKSCSLKYKRRPQDKYILGHYPPDELLRCGQRVVRAIGFEAGEERAPSPIPSTPSAWMPARSTTSPRHSRRPSAGSG
jgi:3'-phosphoadenosine 5'-phosphosulfate sulfotransferase (PAPS reductase)/FAD synthetase